MIQTTVMIQYIHLNIERNIINLEINKMYLNNMSYINGNTIDPVDNYTIIGSFKQTQPFTGTQFTSATGNFIYDTTFVIPKGVWLISACCEISAYSDSANLTDVNIRVALPNNTTGKNIFVFASSGFNAINTQVTEPFYSDGTKSCGVYIYATTNDNTDYTLQGGVNSTMTYIKIA